jgi:S-formylglutathione hydrolase FrmB
MALFKYGILFMSVLGLLSDVAADAGSGNAPEWQGVSLRKIYDYTYECTFNSSVLGQKMKFSLVLPPDYEIKTEHPVMFVLHGLGRDHLTVVNNEKLRKNFVDAGFVTVFPDGKQGWYIDSKVQPDSKFQSYLTELIAMVKAQLKVSRQPEQWVIMGWSMGAFGAANYVMRNPGVFKTMGTIIGLLDFPNSSYAKADNFGVSTLFPADESRWEQYQAARFPECFKGMNIIQFVGSSAFDAKMNRSFHAALLKANIPHEYIEVDGGHEWSVVEKGLPHLLEFAVKSTVEKRPR